MDGRNLRHRGRKEVLPQLKITGVNNYFLDRVASYPTARHTQRPRRLPKLTDAYENQFVTILQ